MLQMNRSVAQEHSRPTIKSVLSSAAVCSVLVVLGIGVVLGGISIALSSSSKASDRIPTQVAGISSQSIPMEDLFVKDRETLKSAREQAAEFVWE